MGTPSIQRLSGGCGRAGMQNGQAAFRRLVLRVTCKSSLWSSGHGPFTSFRPYRHVERHCKAPATKGKGADGAMSHRGGVSGPLRSTGFDLATSGDPAGARNAKSQIALACRDRRHRRGTNRHLQHQMSIPAGTARPFLVESREEGCIKNFLTIFPSDARQRRSLPTCARHDKMVQRKGREAPLQT